MAAHYPSAPALRPVATLIGPWVQKDGTISLHELQEFDSVLEQEAAKWPQAPSINWKIWRHNSRAGVRWWKQEHAKIMAAHKAAGLREIARRWNVAYDRIDRLTDQIKAVPAASLGGIVIKLRVFRDEARREFGSTVPTDADFNDSILLGFSALADAERLLAKGGK